MRAISIHHGEGVRAHLVYEHIKERALERATTLYRKIKEVCETEDVVVVLWAVLMICLTYTAYVRFSKCGEIIGLYVQNRF